MVLLGIGIVWLVSIIAAEQFGDHYRTNANKADKLKAEEEYTAELQARDQRLADVEAAASKKAAADAHELEVARANVVVVTKIIHDKVPIYVSAKADAACVVPVGFIKLHNDAASGTISETAPAADSSAGSVSNDTPSGIALSTIANTIADNYGTCHELETQVAGWKNYKARVDTWYAGVQDALSKGATP
ncbi:MAG: hypothetical protein ACREQO_27550 [Candidatus Binatia bacterium]